MKSRFLQKWGLALGLALLPFAGGCLQEHSNAAVPVQTNAAVAATTEPATTNTIDTPEIPPGPDISSAPAKPVSLDKPVPPEVQPTPPTAEIIKLANSGVEEGVMLAYVTNSPNTFNLGVDQIVYLKDIGVPGAVVTAMILHDQSLKAGSANYPPSGSMLTASSTNVAPLTAEPAAAATNVEQGPPPPATVEPAPTTAPETAPTYQTFYDNLSPYGTWLEVEGYGRVWQPTVVVVNRDWRPYLDNGRWLYTDYGWYWASDYSWGWAPFHYGRWFQHYRYGWCWTPDYVWGPSWVTWRYTSAYCGWAPLPPAACYTPGFGFTYYGSSVGFSFGWGLGWGYYSYVPVSHFHHHHLNRYCVSPHEKEELHHKTVAVNRMIGDRNTVINSGIPVEHVASGSRTEIKKVPVKDLAAVPPRGSRAEQIDASGRLTVYRPPIAAPEGTPTVPTKGEVRKATAPTGGASLAERSRVPTRPGQPEAAAAPSIGGSRPTVPTRYGVTERPAATPSSTTVPSKPSERTASFGRTERPTAARPVAAPDNATIDRSQPGTRSASVPTRPEAKPPVSTKTEPAVVSTPASRSDVPLGTRSVPQRTEPSRYTVTPQRSYSPPVTTTPTQPTPSRPSDRPQSLYNNNTASSGGTSLQVNPRYSTPSPVRPDVSSSVASRPQPSTRYVPPASSAPAPINPSSRSYSVPNRPTIAENRSYSAPAPVIRSAPTYSAPAPAPRSMPSPSYSAPAPRVESAPRATPAPSVSSRSESSPTPSVPSRSSSGNSGNSSGGGPSRRQF